MHWWLQVSKCRVIDRWLCLAIGRLNDSMSGWLSFLLDWHYSLPFHLTGCMYPDQIYNLYSDLAFSSPQPKACGNKSILQEEQSAGLQSLGLNDTYKTGPANAGKERGFSPRRWITITHLIWTKPNAMKRMGSMYVLNCALFYSFIKEWTTNPRNLCKYHSNLELRYNIRALTCLWIISTLNRILIFKYIQIYWKYREVDIFRNALWEWLLWLVDLFSGLWVM